MQRPQTDVTRTQPMSLFLIRHGETALNAARVLQPADTPLSSAGLGQANVLAGRLARLGLAAIVSSDLPRALCTAEAIAAATGLAITTSPLLRERNFGELRGLSYDTLGFDPLAMSAAPSGGESAASFADRIAKAFALLVTMRATLTGPLAVVTPGLVIRAILDAHVDGPGPPHAPARVANASLTIVGALPPHELILLGCTSHLGERDAGSVAGLSAA
jgi:broad specificity phosphatase PhoE